MKKMKHLFSLIIFILASKQLNSFVINEIIYTKQANCLIESYIYNETDKLIVSKKDLQLILNLCYFSYLRSLTTLLAQKKALKNLEFSWNCWQNIAQTRLDPSKKAPHKTEPKQLNQTDLLILHDQHKTIGEIYTHVINNIVHETSITTINALNAISGIRAQSRATVAQSLISVQKILGSFFYEHKKKSQKNFSFLSNIWSYLPQLAMESFIKANKLNDELSEEAWKVIFTMQTFGAETWEKIEEARASFYLAFYKSIYKIAKKNNLEQKYKTILFDKNGIICPENLKCLLPSL